MQTVSYTIADGAGLRVAVGDLQKFERMARQGQQLVILGLTQAGARFRPGDWAERLAGVMSRFRPNGSDNSALTYSPYVVPSYVDGVRCVVVDERLRDLEPLAWKFVCGFAQDNDLQTYPATSVRKRPLAA